MKYGNGVVSIGDPVEVEVFTIINIRGDKRISWIPATVVGFQPEVVVAFCDGSRLVLENGYSYRIPKWFSQKVA